MQKRTLDENGRLDRLKSLCCSTCIMCILFVYHKHIFGTCVASMYLQHWRVPSAVSTLALWPTAPPKSVMKQEGGCLDMFGVFLGLQSNPGMIPSTRPKQTSGHQGQLNCNSPGRPAPKFSVLEAAFLNQCMARCGSVKGLSSELICCVAANNTQ